MNSVNYPIIVSYSGKVLGGNHSRLGLSIVRGCGLGLTNLERQPHSNAEKEAIHGE
jgi:hypothetical protein